MGLFKTIGTVFLCALLIAIFGKIGIVMVVIVIGFFIFREIMNHYWDKQEGLR
jgi:uncharacterized protein YneF (UPF0154 family)